MYFQGISSKINSLTKEVTKKQVLLPVTSDFPLRSLFHYCSESHKLVFLCLKQTNQLDHPSSRQEHVPECI